MNCINNLPEYFDVIETLFKANPAYYNNFNNAAKFILNSNLNNEQKKLAVHSFAHIYDQMAATNSFFERGDAKQVLSLVDGLDNTSAYIESLNRIFGANIPPVYTLEGLSEEFDKLGNLNRMITESDLDKIIPYIQSLLQNKVLRQDILKITEKKLNELIKDESYRKVLLRNITEDTIIEPLYIELNNEIVSAMGLAPQRVVDKDGVTYQGREINGAFHTVEGAIIPSSNYLERPIQAYPFSQSNTYSTNDGKSMFFESTLSSNFNVRALDPRKKETVNSTLRKMANPLDGIIIEALPVDNIRDSRIEQIQQQKGLERRNHETSESSIQKAYLRSNPNGKIVTVSGIKATDQKYVLVGTIIETGDKFYLDTLENFVFVSGDNSTEKIDFTNPQHQKILLERAADSNGAPLTEIQVKRLSDTQKYYREFIRDIKDGDVTERFKKFYRFTNTGIEKQMTLTDLIKEYPGQYAIPVKIITLNNKNERVSEEERLFSIILKQGFDRTNNEITVTIHQTLYNNEVIEYNGKLYTELEFIDELQAIRKLKEFLTKKPNNYDHFVMMFKDGEISNYRSVKMQNAGQFGQFFASFTEELIKALNDPNPYNAVKEFRDKMFEFRTVEQILSIDLNYYDGQLQLVVKPYSTNKTYREIMDPIYFPLDVNMIKDMYKVLSNNGYITALKSIEGFNSAKNLFDVYSLAYKMIENNRGTQDMIGLINLVNKEGDKFARYLIDLIAKPFANGEVGSQEFHNQFNKDKAKYNFTNLVAELDIDRNQYYPKIVIRSKNVQQVEFNKLMARILVQEVEERKMRIVAAAPMSDPQQERIIEVTENPEFVEQKVNPTIKSEEKSITPIKKEFKKKEKPFMLYQETTATTGNKFQLYRDIEWLEKNLNQFGVSFNDMELEDVNGIVLGFFKDDIIYLNNNIIVKGALYHEAFHAVFRRIYTPELRRKMLDTIINKKSFTQKQIDDFLKRRKLEISNNEALDLMAEEVLAEMFREYMLKDHKPSWIGELIEKFLKLLKGLIGWAQSDTIVDSEFKKIRTGFYKTAPLVGDITGAKAYLLIPGLQVIDKKEEVSPQYLTPSQQTNLVGLVVRQMIGFEHIPFDQRFEMATEKVRELFDINNLIRQGYDETTVRKSSEGILYNQYRFILGARLHNESIPDINKSGIAENDNLEDPIPSEIGEQDNTNGQYSNNLLKQLVKDKIAALETVHFVPLEDDMGDEDEDENYQSSDWAEYASINPIQESYITRVRKFFSVIRCDKKSEELGVMIPSVIDGEVLFPWLLDLSANIASDQIIEHIKSAAEIIREDGNIEGAQELQAIYDEINRQCEIIDGKPTKNFQVYNMIVDALYYTKVEMVTFEASINHKPSDQGEVDETYTYTLKDRIAERERDDKKNQILGKWVGTIKRMGRSQTFLSNLTTLTQTLIDLKTRSNLFGLNHPEEDLENWVENLHTQFKIAGLNFPRSLIRLSILAIQENKIGKELDPFAGLSDSTREFYKIHKQFVKEKLYLQEDFFIKLIDIIGEIRTSKGELSQTFFNNIDERKNISDKKYNQLKTTLKKACAYILQYESKELPSVTRNAENKPVYVFARYNPYAILAQDLRGKSLKEVLSEDSYWADYLEDFMKDNPYFSDILSGTDSEIAKQIKMVLENIHIYLFGGVSQKFDGVYKQGHTFKTIDKKSFYMTIIESFLNRTTYTDETGTTAEIYYRPFNQNESTSTNWLVPALYKSFTGKNANGKFMQLRGEDALPLIVGDLLAVIKQEYNSIQKEWDLKDKRKEEYDSRKAGGEGENRFLLNYNMDENENVDNENLRAYNFFALKDFFNMNPTLSKFLITTAKDKVKKEDGTLELVKFEDISKADINKLKSALNEYAQQKYKNYIKELLETKIIEQKTVDVGGVKKNYYVFSMISQNIRTNGINDKPISEYYAEDKDLPVVGDLAYTTRVEALLYDEFCNNWRNGLFMNQLFDGNIRMSVKNFQDAVKRYKKVAASGLNCKFGNYTHAGIAEIKVYVPKTDVTKIYFSIEEIDNDNITVEQKQLYKTEFGKKNMYSIFDGQAVTTLMHRIDMFDLIGRLDDESREILIAKNYRELTNDEIDKLASLKIVNNSLKTIHTSRHTYLKQSEKYIDRNDVSVLLDPKPEVYQILHELYRQVYDKRQELKQGGDINILNSEIKSLFAEIHNYFVPIKGREIMHYMLNSMEYYNVDMLTDSSSSKNATKMPLTFPLNPTDYFDLSFSSITLPMKEKYFQLETSTIHDTARFSIQSKLEIPTDLTSDMIDWIMETNGLEKNEEVKAEIEKLMKEYMNSLRDGTTARFNYFKHVFRKDGDIDVTMLYKMVRDGLSNQNAPTSLIQLFEVDKYGKPVFDQNLPLVREYLTKYFFSLYSKFITDEENEGGQYYHESSLGMNVVVDENNTVIPINELKKNPEKYKNYKTRPLGIFYDKGANTYMVECIIPKPRFENIQEEKFWMEHISKMFGVRIPTQDKSSMVALKVVDFIDSSKQNTLIMPHFAHILAGSDFDIDKLFIRLFAYYKDISGNYRMYGDYTGMEENQGKFLEYIEYISSQPELRSLIADRKKVLAEEEDTILDSVKDLLEELGIEREYINLLENKSLIKLEEVLKQIRTNLFNVERKKEVLEKILSEDPRRLNQIIQEDGTSLQSAFNAYKKLRDESEKLTEETKFLINSIRLKKLIIKYSAIVEIFNEYGLPITQKQFNNSPIAKLTNPKIHQNKNLQDTINIFTNPFIFENLYISQRTSTDSYDETTEAFGLDPKEEDNSQNMATTSFIVNSKDTTSAYKQGVSFTASFHKTLCMANMFSLELRDENVIWNYIDENGKRVILKSFGKVTGNNRRAILDNGDTIGLMTDAVKNNIPNTILLNDVNLSVFNAMVGVGNSTKFATAFNLIPEIRKAVQKIMETREGITKTFTNQFMFFEEALDEQLNILDGNDTVIDKETTKQHKVLKELEEAGLTGMGASENLIIKFTPQILSKTALRSNTLKLHQIGLKVESTTQPNLSEAAQKYILVSMYRAQVSQLWRLRDVGQITSFLRGLNPNFISLDKIIKGVENVATNSIFTTESINRMLGDNVFGVLHREVIPDILNQGSKLFLERGESFRNFVRIFGEYYDDPNVFSNTIVGFIGIRSFLNSFPGSRKSEDAEIQSYIDLDEKNLLEIFTADYWFYQNIQKQIDDLLNKYPDNAFLKALRTQKGTDSVTMMEDGSYVTRHFIKQIIANQAKTKGVHAESIYDGMQQLYEGEMSERLFIRKLLYHELAVTGLTNKQGSFLYFLPPETIAMISRKVTEFLHIVAINNHDERIGELKKFFNVSNNAQLNAVFNNILRKIGYSVRYSELKRKIYESNGFSLNTSNDYRSGLINAFNHVDNPQQAAIDLAKQIFSSVEVSSGKVPRIDFGTVEELIIDFSSVTNHKAGSYFIRNIGGRQFVENGEVIYTFPGLFIRKRDNNKDMYILVGVSNLEEESGAAILDALTTGNFTNKGLKARYMRIPVSNLPNMLSAVGFPQTEIERYQQLITNKTKLNEREQKPQSTPDAANLNKTLPVEREYTPENITSLQSNEFFVFGSNDRDVHGPIDKSNAWYKKFWEYVNKGYYQQFIRDLQKTKSISEINEINKQIRTVYIEQLKQKYPELGNITLQSDNSTLAVENIKLLKSLEPTFTRLMVGNHGIYMEFNTPSDKGTFIKQRKQYNEYKKEGTKLYDQFDTVNYADYKIGKWYKDINEYNFNKITSIEKTTGLKDYTNHSGGAIEEIQSTIPIQKTLSTEQESFAKKNKIEQNFYHLKPYPKEKDIYGNVTKWEVYKSKNSKSSMKAALDGERTETTRSESQIALLHKLAENQGITDGITGTIVWMEGQIDNTKNSTNIQGDWFRITSEPYTPNEKDFNAYENWEPNVWKDRKEDFKIGQENEWKSIRFERIQSPETNTPMLDKTNELSVNDKQNSSNEITYTPKGKTTQVYTIKGSQIFNKEGKEVFKEDSIDRNKIFANLRVLQGEAVIINYKDAEYVVNKKNQIISVTSGKIMQWGDENGNRKEILKKATEQFFLKSDNPLTRFYYSQPEEKRQRLGNLEDLQYQFEHSGVSIESFIEYLKCK